MTDAWSTLEVENTYREAEERAEDTALALMIAWASGEPHRIGEVALFEEDGGARILGRGASESSERVAFFRQRPGVLEPAPPLAGQGISREQLRIRAQGQRLHVECIGRCPLYFAGERVDGCMLAPGDTLLLKGQLLLYGTRRPRRIAPLRDYPPGAVLGFGEPDACGIVGESPAAWRLRERLAWLARAGAHILIFGESGTGKELAARALHGLSARADGAFIARSAATIPASLIDAELFGNVKGYPNPGMPERPGLIGAADRGTLFLDEIGELPMSLQANLLRVLDGNGEYHRLGAATVRRADFRLIGATNRDLTALKHDFAARLALRLVLPALGERREDIPLLVRHVLRRAASKSPEVVLRFFAAAGGMPGEPRLRAELVEVLLKREYTTNLRELDALLWQCMAESSGDVIGWTGERGGAPASTDTGVAPPRIAAAALPGGIPGSPEPASGPSPEEIRACLETHGGNIARAARALGLSSRYALYRLMKKHGIEAGKEHGEEP